MHTKGPQGVMKFHALYNGSGAANMYGQVKTGWVDKGIYRLKSNL